jgi:Ran GTPase-activating protein (RanGAP) involved in mRNA processing and transport
VLEAAKQRSCTRCLSTFLPPQSLTHLDVRASRVTDAGARHIINALASNCTLLSLNLGNCSISDASVDAICHVITTNRTLKSLHLQGCDLSQPALQRVLHTARDSGRFDGMCANALDAPGVQNNMLQEVGCCVC